MLNRGRGADWLSTMAIYLSLGPSGAGKDTLLLAGRALLEESSAVVFLPRHLTRDAASITDLEVSVTPDEFAAGITAEAYALHWEAHGTQYGVPSADLTAALREGRRCVLNVSRTQVPVVLEKFGDRFEVYVLHITASLATLRTRLLARGRESPADVEKRLARAVQDVPRGSHVITVLNEATVEEGATRVARALQGTLKYSLWLLPAGPVAAWVRMLIAGLAAEAKMAPFPAHVTLCPSFEATQRDAVAKARAVVEGLPPGIHLELESVVDSTAYFRAIVVALKVSKALVAATETARGVLFPEGDLRRQTAFEPHLSLLYGNHEATDRAALAAAVGRWPNGPCPVGAVALVCTTGNTYACWPIVETFPLTAAGEER